jgi:hypothetical protein
MAAERLHASRDLIDRCFAGTLAGPDWDELFVHLRGCPDCRDHFERTRLAFRALGGKPPATPLGLARAEADIIRAALLPAPTPLARRLRLPPLALVLAGGAALAIPLAIALRRPPPVSDGFAERGGPTAALGFDVLCVPSSEQAVPVSASAVKGRCAPGSFLKAVVTKPDGSLPHVLVVAVDPAFKIRARLRAEAAGSGPVVAAGHTQLGANEAFAFVALFSRKPVAEAAVDDAVAAARRSGIQTRQMSGLSVAGTIQRVVWVEASEPPNGR